MPIRATKRGAERTPLDRDVDVLICGASFAGLAVARELAHTRARVLLVDRYDIGEKQTSACAAPTEWLTNLGLDDAILQTFGRLKVHTAKGTSTWPLPWTFSTFDYRRLCALLFDQCGDAEFETAKVDGITRSPDGHTCTPTAATCARRSSSTRSAGGACSAPAPTSSRPRRTCRAASRCTRPRAPTSSSCGSIRSTCPEGYSWSFPARDEVRVGVGSFDPRYHVKDPTVELARDVGLPPEGFQGNWIPHKLRKAVDDGVFFTGDSAGHCLPVTAEGIRTALYFGLACGRELAAVVEGRRTRARRSRATARSPTRTRTRSCGSSARRTSCRG
jgi:flavin-dependent dehydrogenase